MLKLMSTDPPTAGCYCFIFSLMATLLIIDGALNVLATKAFIRDGFLKIVSVAFGQIFNIVCTLLTFAYCIFRTYVAKAGFIGILVRRFRSTVIISIMYLFLTVILHLVSIVLRFTAPLEYNWPTYLKLIFFCHRFVSMLWYYTCKRAILRLGDPRFYDEEWVRHTLVHHDSPLAPKPLY